MDPWFLLQTKPKRESDVEVQLARAGFELFCPQIRGIRSPKPLFPSYLFIRSDLGDPHTHRLVRFTRGVRRVLGDDEGPIAVTQLIVETLREQTRDGRLIEQELLLREGELVRVKRGLLKDLVGIVEKNLPERGRVKILFKWLKTSGRMRATLPFSHLERAA